VPGEILSTVNLMSFFGLHRRWRGAIVGHLALFEMCSVVPMGRYVEALDRVGVADAVPFYAAHVVADEWHQTIALEDMVGSLVIDEPALADDIVFGAPRARSSRTRVHATASRRVVARRDFAVQRSLPRDRSAIMTATLRAPRVGLVLGAGGTVGAAYHAGALTALQHDLGWDARDAAVVVGTSAGSIVGRCYARRAAHRPCRPHGRRADTPNDS